jgi:hypothetical protein
MTMRPGHANHDYFRPGIVGIGKEGPYWGVVDEIS